MRLAPGILLAFVLSAGAQPTYWWTQIQRKPDAQQSQEFWFVPGQDIVFTYSTNHVIINAVIQSTNLAGFFPGTNITFTTNVHGLKINASGGGSTVGLTTNIPIVFANNSPMTNILNFVNGLLVSINGHPDSIILPGGGYLLQINSGTLLLP